MHHCGQDRVGRLLEGTRRRDEGYRTLQFHSTLSTTLFTLVIFMVCTHSPWKP